MPGVGLYGGDRGRGGGRQDEDNFIFKYDKLNFDSNIGNQVIGSANFSSSTVANTSNTTQLIDGICEGPIEGWPTSEPLKHVYLDGTPIKSYNNTINTGNIRFEFRNGTTDQSPLSQYTIIGAVKSPNWLNEIDDIAKTGGNGAIIQQVQIRDDTDGAYPPVEAVAFTFTFPEGLFRYQTSGGRDNTPCGIKIELNNKSDGSGTWYTKVEDLWNQEITSGEFEVTYIVELPPGWATAAGLQEYSTPNFADDIVQFRISKLNSDIKNGVPNEKAHNKLYLKNYSIYTRNQFSFPYTALAGLTIDSRNFDGSVPTRMYDLKLLKVKVPSNYYTVVDSDGKVVERNYYGTWDGTFKTALEWTDNPAWCFYDLITNERYGLGKYIDPTLINKWTLYEIAKYCDAVVSDTRGTYPASDSKYTWTSTSLAGQTISANSFTYSQRSNLGGVASGVGISAMKEPRFTCNLLIKDREEAYSVIQRMASLFRGIVYFQHGQLKIIQDRDGVTPTFAFNNTNVIDGTFSYSSSSAKARHTVAIVRWLDPDDLYSEKLEYVEDYDGMARYGYREIEIDGFGCTSKGQARRIGRHILTTEKFELETISFKVGMEGATVTVGSLIKIKDSMRQLKRAGGRIVSATTNTITVDSTINIPSNVVLSSIKLWVELPYASQDLLADGTYSNDSLKPTLQSYSLAGVAAGGNYTVFTLSSGTFTYSVNGTPTTVTPTAGNIWLISYDTYVSGTSGPTVDENTSIYKVLSVVENNSYEYEITALQSYQAKYAAIEAYSPLPEYKPTKFKLYVPPPSQGWFSVNPSINKGFYDIKLNWRMERNISGTKYRVAIKKAGSKQSTLVSSLLDTSYTYTTSQRGTYYFYIYTLASSGKQVSTPLKVGPVVIKEVLPQNNFDTFNQTFFTSNSITNTWDDDAFPNDSLSYETWRSTTNNLRTLQTVGTNKTISAIDYINKTITLNNFNNSTLTDTISTYRVESPIYPYIKYKTTDVNKFGIVASTSTTLIVLTSSEKPDVSIGDKVFNATRSNNPTTSDNPKATNVVGVTFSNPVPNVWYTQITVSPAVTSQVSGDTIYIYKGIMGVGLTEVQPSAAIKQKIVKAQTGTTTTTLVGLTGVFANVNTNDLIVNKTRGVSTAVTKVDNQTLTCNTTVTGQTAGDQIAIYQYPTKESRSLAKFKINYLSSSFGGDAVILKDVFDPDLLSQAKSTILVNLTRSKAAEVMAMTSTSRGIEVSYYPSITGVANDDEVILLKKDEVFLSSIGTYIHPAVTTCSTGTTSSVVTSGGTFFSGIVAGDILVNARRNTSAVIATVNSTTQVTLVGATITDFVIDGQVPGDGVFVIKASDISSSFNEILSYNYPTVYTTIATTNTTTVTATGAFASITGTPGLYMLYNATRNAYSYVASKTNNDTIVLAAAITGQTTGDKIYTFIPSGTSISTSYTTVATTNTTTVTATGAFTSITSNITSYILYNATRNSYSYFSSKTNNNTIVLATAITGQTTGDTIYIISPGVSSTTQTVVTAPDGAFKHARAGDLFWNKTRNAVSTILDVTTLTGRIDKKIDKLTLNSAITGQSVGDEFIILQGYYSGIPTSFASATNKITLRTLTGLGVGDTVNIYKMNATRLGVTSANSIVDSGLDPNTTYYYWMRVVSPRNPYITGSWKPTDTTGDPATTLPFGVINYTNTNDNNASAITIPITGSTITGAKNKDSTYDVSLKWEWLGHSPTLDGFTMYFWSSGSATDDATVLNDTDYVKAQTGISVPRNVGTAITAVGLAAQTTGNTATLTAGAATVTMTSTTGLVPGQKVTKTAGTGAFGTGSGLTLNTVTRGGELRRVSSIASGGTKYSVGDIVTVAGGTGGTVRVTATNGSAGIVTGVIVHSIGSGYSNASGATTTLAYPAGPFIVSVDTGTQITLSVTNTTAGAITFTCEQAVTVTTSVKGLSIGDPIRINSVSGLSNLNNNSTTTVVPGTDHYIITNVNTGASTVTFDTTSIVGVTGTVSGGRLIPCKYNYTVNNITANYYFNAWAQPYRSVNSTISENGVITGDVRMVYNG